VSVRQQLRDTAIAELNAAPPTGVPECGKRRYIPGENTSEARLAAFFGEEDASRPQGAGGALTKRTLTLVIQGIVVVERPEQADDAMEPLLEHVVAIMGNTNLGGLATDVAEVSTLWASAESGRFILVALTRWKIQYQTKRNDLTARS
jgi:hypothetical protein